MAVAVIGAGAAGLCAARHLTTADRGFSCVVYEQTGQVGGTWVYTDNTGNDQYGLPILSAMYKNLRTNLPTINMEFLGFPFTNCKSFVQHSEVLKYLEDYADFYELKQYIQFFHQVKNITPKNNKWLITVVDLPNSREYMEEFDAVVICNGHYSSPLMGHFPGISEFRGEIKHSHSYRTPEPFANKTVLVCGGGPSGVDITYDLADVSPKVYFSHRSDIRYDAFPENVEQVPVVERVTEKAVIFENGMKSGDIDVILICTGYKYAFPFLSPECGITVLEDKCVYPLYKHIVNVKHPTMGFIGLMKQTFVFPLFDYQVQYYVKTLTGEVELGSEEEMLADISTEILKKKEQGIPLEKYHDVGLPNMMQSYIEELGHCARLAPLPPVKYKVYYATAKLRKHHLSNYRDAIFEEINDDEFDISGLLVDKKELVSSISLSS